MWWHLQFCQGCDPNFTEQFTTSLETHRIVPGQAVVTQNDFLMVMTRGNVQITDNESEKEGAVAAPLIMCGVDRSRNLEMISIGVCEIYRLKKDVAAKLAEAFPKDSRIVFERFMAQQLLLANTLGQPWFTQHATLTHQREFNEIGAEFLVECANQMQLELYMPGEMLVEEGRRTDSTLILESGKASVEKRDVSSRLFEIEDGYWIGGIAGICGFSGERRRKATLRAMTICKVHRIITAKFIETLQNYPAERERFRLLAQNQLRSNNAERLEDHDFFKSFPKAVLNLLRAKCRPLVYFAGEVLMRQGELAETLFVLGADSHVYLEIDGRKFKELTGRACLGTVAILSKRNVTRASTVVTRTACAVLTLSRGDWLDTFKHHPENRPWMQNFTNDCLKEVKDERKTHMSKLAWGKIRERDETARQLHCKRAMPKGARKGRSDSDRSSSPRPERGLSITPEQTRRRQGAILGHMARKPGQAEVQDDTVQVWDCFNGQKVEVPHTRLPRLHIPAEQGSVDASEETPIGGGDIPGQLASVMQHVGLFSVRNFFAVS